MIHSSRTSECASGTSLSTVSRKRSSQILEANPGDAICLSKKFSPDVYSCRDFTGCKWFLFRYRPNTALALRARVWLRQTKPTLVHVHIATEVLEILHPGANLK